MTHLVLIGGFGFVGRNILEAISDHEMFSALTPLVIDDLSNACRGYKNLDVAHHIGRYEDDEAGRFLADLAPGQRIFVFLAGETRVAESKDRPLDFITANISDPAKFVLSNLRDGDSFILISTAGALFDGTFEVRVNSKYCPKNFYGATKAAEEMVLEKLTEMRGAQFSVVRMTNVYGAYSDNKKSAIHAFTRAALAGGTVTLNGDGKQTRDFVFAGDVGRGIAMVAEKMRVGDGVDPVYMLGSGTSVSLMDIVKTIETATGKPLRYEQIAATDLLATEPRDVIASPEDVRVLLGDSLTALDDGIGQTANYYSRKN